MITVGIDFDNTLIDYHRLFAMAACDFGWIDTPHLSRTAVKALLLHEDSDDIRWQQLQTAVYSQYIKQAQPYAGAKEFCEKVIANGDNVLIISHKTRFSNYDQQTDLIEPAKRWLLKQGFIGENGILADESVYFLETLEQKIQTICRNNIDLFIDDLSKVLLDRYFPEKTVAVLFSDVERQPLITSDSWLEISVFYNVCKIAGMVAASSLAAEYKTLPRAVSELAAGGNNNLFKIDWKYQTLIAKTAGNILALKNEYDALVLMAGIANIPKAVLFDGRSGVLLETMLCGDVIDTPNDRHLCGAVDFLIVLDNFGSQGIKYRMASHYRDSLSSYLENVEIRLNVIKRHLPSLREIEQLNRAKLIIDQLEKIWKIVKRRFLEKSGRNGLCLSEKFPPEEMILSPSDYGFHNMLAAENEVVKICDFEYFGWDDKAKLVADFFHHQGHQLTDQQRLLFIRKAFDKKLINNSVIQRLELVLDIIGIEWILIILNILDQSRLKQKIQANANANALASSANIVNRQIGKASILLENYMQRTGKHHFFVTSAIDAEQWASCYV